MKLTKLILLITAVILFATNSAFAAPSYSVNVDTSSFAGSTGYLYYQFNPGTDITPAATATVANLTGTALGFIGSVVDGTYVTGMLPGSVLFANTGAINDYNHAVTFGNSLAYTLAFTGGQSVGDLQSGSVFSFGLFQDEFGATPLLDSNGNLYTVNIDLNTNGTTSILALTDKISVTATPLPAAAWLLTSGLVGLVGVRRMKRA